MKAPLSLFLSITTLTCLLSACAPYRPDSTHAGTCNEMNSRMIFWGNTSNIRQAEIQESQQPLLQHSYDVKCDS